MGIQRYRLSVGVGYEPRVEPHPEGEWVTYQDVAAKFAPLLEQGAKAIAEGSAAMAELRRVRELVAKEAEFLDAEGQFKILKALRG